jgi:hypothetical protein
MKFVTNPYKLIEGAFQPHPIQLFYTPHNEVVGGYTGFTMSVRPSVDKSYVVR